MTQWSAHTAFESIGPGTAMLIFEATIAGRPVNTLKAGDAIDITLGGALQLTVKGAVHDVDQHGADIVLLSDGTKWRMTRRGPTEPPVGVIWTSSPTQEWVIRSPA